MTPRIEYDREDDGQWIAEVVGLPGVMCYGSTQLDAARAAKVLALRVVAERDEADEEGEDPLPHGFGRDGKPIVDNKR